MSLPPFYSLGWGTNRLVPTPARDLPQASSRRSNVIDHTIRCEVLEVRTGSGVCPGLAKTRQGETYTFGARTPAAPGICVSAFNALQPMALAMRLTDKMSWEKQETFDVTCPHGFVTYRISRLP